MLSNQHQGPANQRIVIRPEDIVGRTTATSAAHTTLKRPRDLAMVIVALGALLTVAGVVVVLLLAANWYAPLMAGRSAARRNATLEYWNQLRQIGDHLHQNADAGGDANQYAAQLQEQQTALGRAIDEITRLTTLNVDEDAINVGSKMAEILADAEALLASLERLVRDAETLTSRAASTEVMVESFIRGFLGDPLGTSNELRAQQGELSNRERQFVAEAETLQRKTKDLQILANRVRARLTERFGTEFPPIE
jgi:hypothetical protein